MAGHTMSKVDEMKLRKNHVDLVKQLIVGPEFFAVMRDPKFRVFTADLQEEVEAGRTTNEKAGNFLRILMRRGPNAFETFIKALVCSEQENLAMMLDPNLCEKHRKLLNENPSDEDTPMDQLDMTYLPGTADIDKSTEDILKELENENCNLINIQAMTDLKKASLQKREPNHVYPMKPPYGRALIINNRHFTNLKNRYGTEYDLKNLTELFEKLRFEVVSHDDLNAQEICDVLDKEQNIQNAQENKYSAFILCILSHGEQNKVCGNDGKTVDLSEIFSKFDGKNCPGLLRKPKLFFIQACQGDVQTKGVISSMDWKTSSSPMSAQSDSSEPSDETDGTVKKNNIHEKADIFIAMSSVEGYVSWRHSEKGTFFIRCLVYVLSRWSHSVDLDKMMTKVNDVVSQLKTTKGELQMPEKKSSLRKEFYFRP